MYNKLFKLENHFNTINSTDMSLFAKNLWYGLLMNYEKAHVHLCKFQTFHELLITIVVMSVKRIAA